MNQYYKLQNFQKSMLRPILCVLILCVGFAKRALNPQLIKQIVIDEPEIVRLAEQQKFTIPLNGRTISHSITFHPANNGQCQFVQPTLKYQSVAECQTVFNEDEQIMAILPLTKHQILYIADPFYNIAAYSLDQHSLLKSLAPKKSLKPDRNQSDIASPTLVATSNQQLIYYLIPGHVYVFQPISLSSQLLWFELEGEMQVITKGMEFMGFIILSCGESGVYVYRINNKTKTLSLSQTIKESSVADVEIDRDRKLVYVLYDDRIAVYNFNLPDYYKDFDSANDVLKLHDLIKLENITFHTGKSQEDSKSVNLEISRGRSEQTLLILFKHNKRSVVAEITYQPSLQEFFFIRYYKFIMQIHEIHTIDDVMVVVGNGILGIFPYDIDPRLINEEFNGIITMSPIERLVITEIPFFVGVTKNTIEYGGIFFGNKAGLNCHINETSNLKNITFKANLTSCSSQDKLSFRKYCEYYKIFIIQQMDFSIIAPIADSLWVAIIVFTVLIVLGISTIFIMYRKKEQDIRKLELYFQEKKKSSQIPVTSARQGQSRL